MLHTCIWNGTRCLDKYDCFQIIRGDCLQFFRVVYSNMSKRLCNRRRERSCTVPLAYVTEGVKPLPYDRRVVDFARSV